jgi:hypothetical protein
MAITFQKEHFLQCMRGAVTAIFINYIQAWHCTVVVRFTYKVVAVVDDIQKTWVSALGSLYVRVAKTATEQ